MVGRSKRVGIGALCATFGLFAAGAAGVAAARAVDGSPSAARAPLSAGRDVAAQRAGAFIELFTTPLQRGTKAQIAVSAIGVQRCSLTFEGPAGLRSGPFGVGLRVQQVQWTWIVPNDAHAGRWTATVACQGAQAASASLMLTAASVGTQSIVRRDSLSVAALTPSDKYDGGKGSGTTCAPGVLDPTSGYCTGYCTELVWKSRPDLDRLGDASKWWARTTAQKGSVPALRAVAWWRARSPGRPFGHVAVVVGYGAGTVTVREMNHGKGNWNVEDVRTINLDSQDAPDGYIYEGQGPVDPKPKKPLTTAATTPVVTVTAPTVTLTTVGPTVTAPPTTVTVKTTTLQDPVNPTTTPLAPAFHEVAGSVPVATYVIAGSTSPSGALIEAGAAVDVSCKVTLADSIDPMTSPDGVWYRLSSPPWDNTYYARAGAFLNGQPQGTSTPTSADPAVEECPPPPTETTTTAPTTVDSTPAAGAGPPVGAITPTITPGKVIAPGKVVVRRARYKVQAGPFGAQTFDEFAFGSRRGPRVSSFESVDVFCKAFKYSRNTRWITPHGYWYLVASQPWAGFYFAPATAFLNGDPAGGPFRTHVQRGIPLCSG